MDFEWIKEYEIKPFYENDIQSIKIFFFYCNEKNELVNIK